MTTVERPSLPQAPAPTDQGGLTTTSRIGRPSRRVKPRVRISTTELLTAVNDLGPSWPVRFGGYELVDVSEALDRELIAGNLRNATTITDQGRRVLRDDSRAHAATQ